MASYLSHYAEPDSREMVFPRKKWDEGVVVPVCGEPELSPLIESIDKAANFSHRKVLLLLVVNSRSDTSLFFRELNDRVLRTFADFQSFSNFLDIAVWDRHSQFPLPEKQGVGLARKIGADILLSLAHQGRIRSTFIHSTDGDALFSQDYFNIPTNANVSCYLHPFRHLLDNEDPIRNHALFLYDSFLRYHQLHLKRASSPYSYIPLGSNLSFSIKHYEVVRGFPKREAGEDFYFLNKLAKVGNIVELSYTLTELRSRSGVRVPFGTNRSVSNIEELLRTQQNYLTYHPNLYEELKFFLESLNLFSQTRDILKFKKRIEASKPVMLYCEAHEVANALEKAARQRKSPSDLTKHLNDWFDAFKTLKFLHYVESFYPKIPLKYACPKFSTVDEREA